MIRQLVLFVPEKSKTARHALQLPAVEIKVYKDTELYVDVYCCQKIRIENLMESNCC